MSQKINRDRDPAMMKHIIVKQGDSFVKLVMPPMDKDALARAIAKSMEERKTLLKISAMNLYEIEENSRDELLVEYKRVFKETVALFDECLKKHLKLTDQKSGQIRYAFFPYMYGIYPYSYPTKKQISAMEEVKLSYVDVTIYEMTYQFLKLIL